MLVASAKTGSGKTLAFLIPIIDLLFKSNFSRIHGCGAIILSPTRELALQTYRSEIIEIDLHLCFYYLHILVCCVRCVNIWNRLYLRIPQPPTQRMRMRRVGSFD